MIEPTTTDAALVRQILGGDSSAFSELVGRHERRVRRVVLAIVADVHQAEDVTQEAFLIAYRRLETWRGARDSAETGSIAGWLLRIATREALRAKASWSGVARRWISLQSEPTARPHRDAAAAEESFALLAHLRPRERAALVLHVVEERSYGEIATALSCTEGTVGSLISRARARVRQFSEWRERPRSTASARGRWAAMALPLGDRG